MRTFAKRMFDQLWSRKTQLALAVRIASAGVAAYAIALALHLMLPLWAVLTSLIVTQMSVGRSLKATRDYMLGTIGGAIYGGAIAVLIPHSGEGSLLALLVLAVLETGMSADEIAGKIVLQAIPGAIGAMLARSQLGQRDAGGEEESRRDTYGGELFLAGVGAMFMAFNVAPTDEIVLIALMMTEWHAIALVAGSLLMMHGFVYAVGFRGTAEPREGSAAREFVRLTAVAYVLSLLISLYVLWTFGRTDGLGLEELVKTVLVLGFPAAIGAAAARLIL
mgnify:CR=1 FL=1